MNIGELSIGIKGDEAQFNSFLTRVKTSFQKLGNDIEKAVGNKALTEIKKDALEATKTIGGLNAKLQALNKELENTEIGSRKFKQLQKDIRKTEQELKKATGAGSGLLGKLKSFGPAIAGALGITAITAFTKKSLELASALEMAHNSFETLLGSKEKADKMMADIATFASKTPFSQTGLTKLTQQLIGMGMEADKALPTLKILGDSISALGRGEEDLQGVVLALGQIQAKGKLSTEEVLQMAERGLPVFEILQEKLGLTKEQIGNLGNQGIDSATAINAILVGLSERFAGQMEKQASTLTGKWSNFQDNLTIITGQIGLQIQDTFKNILDGVNNFFDENGNTIIEWGSDILDSIINTFKIMWDIIVNIWTSISETITDVLDYFGVKTDKTTGGVGKMFQWLFKHLILGFQGILLVFNSVIGGLIVAFKSLWNYIKLEFFAIKNGIKALGVGITTFFDNLKNAGGNIADYIANILKDWANGIIEWINGIIGWINKIGSYIGKGDLVKEVKKFEIESKKSAEKSKSAWDEMKKAFTENGEVEDAFKNLKDGFDFSEVGKQNDKIIAKIQATLDRFDKKQIKNKKLGLSLEEKIKKKTEEMKKELEKQKELLEKNNKNKGKNNDISKKGVDIAKQRAKEEEKIKKQEEKQLNTIKKQYEKYLKLVEKLKKKQEENKKKEIKWNYDIAMSISDIRKQIQKNINKYNELINKIEEEKQKRLGEIENNKQEKLARRLLELEKQRKELMQEIQKMEKENPGIKQNKHISLATLESIGSGTIGGEHPVDVEKLIEYKKQAEQIKKINQEIGEINKVVNQKVVEQIKNYEKLSETQKILLEAKKEKEKAEKEAEAKKQKAEQELQKEKEKLETKLKIYEFFQKKKHVTQKEINKLLQDERMKLLDKETRDLILQLANRKMQLTLQAQEEINLKKQVADAEIALQNRVNNIMLNNIKMLKNQYISLISTINAAIRAQARLRASKNKTRGFAEGGYTGDGPKNEVAGVVHKGEYVIPKHLVQKVPSVIQQLENIRNSKTIHNIKKEVNLGGVQVANQIDIELLVDKLKWKL